MTAAESNPAATPAIHDLRDYLALLDAHGQRITWPEPVLPPAATP